MQNLLGLRCVEGGALQQEKADHQKRPIVINQSAGSRQRRGDEMR